MAVTHNVTQTITAGGRQVPSNFQAKQYSAGMNISLAEPAPDDATTEMLVAIDVSTVKSIVLASDQDVTVKTNDAGTPDDTIALKAGVPYVWNTDSYDTLLLTVDVTAFHVVNASGEEATLEMECLVDPTP
jgi:hypothetical protein